MRARTIRLSCLLPSLVACASLPPTGSDAIRPPELREPVFVVVPANQSSMQEEYATRVEQQLLSSGMRVAVRPTFKAVRIETAESAQQSGGFVTGSASGIGAASAEGEDRVVDSFLAMADTKAHYRINTYAGGDMVELVDLSNQQVLAVVSSGREVLSGILSVIGFPVTQTKEHWQPMIAATSQASPILTVVPSSDLPWEADYALRIERLLVGLGLHIVRPPAPHYREQSATLTKAAASSFPSDVLGKATSARRVESFWELDETAASVILETTSYGNTVKIIDKASKEVRSVVNIYVGGVGPFVTDGIAIANLRDALIAAGIKVAEPVKRPEPVQQPAPVRQSKKKAKAKAKTD